MKKLNVLLIVAMLAASLLAANPAGKLVRLEVINASGDTVYMRLNGRNTGAFYYLTIPDNWDKTFTVLVDSYKRTTWACGGIVSGGSLNMTGNVKLKFVQCGTFPIRHVMWDLDGDGVKETYPSEFCAALDLICGDVYPNFGEPTQEKVVYWKAYTNWFYSKRGVVLAIYGPGLWNSFAMWAKFKTTSRIVAMSFCEPRSW